MSYCMLCVEKWPDSEPARLPLEIAGERREKPRQHRQVIFPFATGHRAATIQLYWCRWKPRNRRKKCKCIFGCRREPHGNIVFTYALCAYLQRITRWIRNINYTYALNTLYAMLVPEAEWYAILNLPTCDDQHSARSLCGVHFILSQFSEWINAHSLRCCQKLMMATWWKQNWIKFKRKKNNTKIEWVKLIFHDFLSCGASTQSSICCCPKFRVWGVASLMAFLDSIFFFLSFARTLAPIFHHLLFFNCCSHVSDNS